MQPGQHARRRKLEVHQTERKQGERDGKDHRHHEARCERSVEDLGIARPQILLPILATVLRGCRHRRLSPPRKWPRIQPVPMSMTNTERIMRTRMALTSE